ncbi:CHAT domain-containing tetratricopeptide repeat protein [Marivirga salinae]|uniref:CHAT domain-containing tetratricopeptide repeat protein n=1 Tax=Marivirga salinarum TaxID=3059078 RepID=A0AA51NC88_9BACT|nr:CHAT domain-containing tetratricopeptide repeat protein [Marivirga sp. BDSF4-3]WMN10931.1 CHAT domain-containing tetratricopeptide repeat protein [Marivirga sp. BDSF4-3]
MLKYSIFLILFSISTFSFGQLLSEDYHKAISESRSNNIDQLINQVKSLESSLENRALIAELYFLKGRNDLAKDLLEQILNKESNSISKSSEIHARLLKNYGLLLWNAGKDDQALEYLRQSLKYYGQIEGIGKVNEADLFNNIGLVFSQTNDDEAIRNYEKALEIYETDVAKYLDKIIQISINISLVEVNQGNYVNALRLLNEALGKWNEAHQKGLPTEGFIKANIGAVYLNTDQFILAEDYFNEAKEIYQQNYGTRHSELANVFAQLSELKLKQQEYEESLSYIQRALKANSFKFEKLQFTSNPKADDVNNLDLQVVLLLRKASILENYYFGYSLKRDHLIFALDAIDLADELLVNMRASTNNKKDLLDLSALSAELYEDGQRISLQLDDVTLLGDKYIHKAFSYSEKSKSSMLYNAVIEAEAKSFARIPNELLEKEKSLTSQMAYLNNQISLESDQMELNYLRDRYFQVKSEFQKFINDLEKVYPDYFNLKHQNKEVEVTNIQEKLMLGEIIFEYSMAPKTNEIYLYTITKDDFSFNRIYFKDEIIKYIKAYRNTMVYNLPGSFKEISFSLFNYLFPKGIKGDINKLIIVPDGELSTIPFDALIQNEIKENDQAFYELDYLIQDYEINYAYSASLYNSQFNKEYVNESLLISPVEFGNEIPALPASEEEAEHFISWSEKQQIEVNALVKSSATEANFKKSDLESYRFIHLATHGTVNMESPDLSGVYFKQTENGGLSEDGILYVGEIYGLSINAELVVLSACETGLGKINRGEGVMGLGQAFAFSGADNLILSLWKVADNSTSFLMKSFYDNQLDVNKASFSSSLRKAKLDLINSDYSAPYYWAPFILWGK